MIDPDLKVKLCDSRPNFPMQIEDPSRVDGIFDRYFGQVFTPTVQILNLSTASKALITSWTNALQAFIDGPFYSSWKTRAKLVFPVTKITPPNWGIIFLNNDKMFGSNTGLAGVHRMSQDGRPMGFVFMEASNNSGHSPSLTYCHEILEMLSNPWFDKWIKGPENVLYMKENCDAIQMDTTTYNGVEVSNFQYPSYFNIRSESGPYDLLGILSKPFSLSSGGYMTIKEGTDGPTSNIFGGIQAKNAFKIEEHGRIQAGVAGRDRLKPIPPYLLDKELFDKLPFA